MKASILLLLGCLGLVAVSLIDGHGHLFERTRRDSPADEPDMAIDEEENVYVTRKTGSEGDNDHILLEFGDGRTEVLEMIKNVKLDRHTKTYELKGNQRTEVPVHRRGCFYQEKSGAAALNMCYDEAVEGVINRKAGHMIKITRADPSVANSTEEKEEDLMPRRRRSTGVLHSASRVKRDHDLTAGSVLHLNIDAELDKEVRRKRRQSPSVAEVELAFVVDNDVYLHHGSIQATHDYVLNMANMLDIYYKTVTNPTVTISVSSIYIMTSRTDATVDWLYTHVDSSGVLSATAGTVLTSFAEWLHSAPTEDDYDHAMLLTGLDLCYRLENGQCFQSLEGLAWLGGTCFKTDDPPSVYGSSVVEDHGGYTNLLVAAHELGHSLGATHDGQSNPLGGPGALACPENLGYIMGYPMERPAFTTCSADQFHYFLGFTHASCLFETNAATHYEPQHNYPGASVTIEEQCRNNFGQNSEPCPWAYSQDICKGLLCTLGSTYCSSMGPALTGTPCAGGFCYEEGCVADLPDSNAADVNGGWSAWTAWKRCSKTCGGGIKSRFRYCTNPYPMGNGAVCSGTSSETTACNEGDC